jgi:hypothetical protein
MLKWMDEESIISRMPMLCVEMLMEEMKEQAEEEYEGFIGLQNDDYDELLNDDEAFI